MGQERQCLWVEQQFRSLENMGKHSLLIFRDVVVLILFLFGKFMPVWFSVCTCLLHDSIILETEFPMGYTDRLIKKHNLYDSTDSDW